MPTPAQKKAAEKKKKAALLAKKNGNGKNGKKTLKSKPPKLTKPKPKRKSKKNGKSVGGDFSGTTIHIDVKLPAKPRGKRTTAWGTVYYEHRKNMSDSKDKSDKYKGRV